MMHRRQKRQYVIGGILAVVAVVNLLFFFILLRPARSDFFNLQKSIDSLHSQVNASKATKVRLEKTSDQLERFEQDRERLFGGHFIKFDPGFAELSPRLEQMALQSGVLRPVVDFTRNEVKQYGLYSVKIKIPVTGTYSNAVNFIKALESSDTFFVIESIDVKGGGDAGAAPNSQGSVSLALALETFFYK